MFDENSELVMNVFPDGRFTMRIRCVHGDSASVIPIPDISVKMLQKILHHITQEQFMDYSEEFGLSFACPVSPYVDKDGEVRFKIIHD